MSILSSLSVIIVSLLCYTQVKAAVNSGQIIEAGPILVYFERVELTVTEGVSPPRAQTLVYNNDTTVSTKLSANNTSLTLTFGTGSEKVENLEVTSFSTTFALAKRDYWTLSNFTANIEGKFGEGDTNAFSFKDEWFLSPMELAAPMGMSFHCSKFGPLYVPKKTEAEKGPPVETKTFIPSIKIIGFQIQAFMDPFDTNPIFGTSYDCVGFFSIGILSGIFINIILMAILSWGLVMIMNVKTMDRFDDPKGKPISVGSTD